MEDVATGVEVVLDAGADVGQQYESEESVAVDELIVEGIDEEKME